MHPSPRTRIALAAMFCLSVVLLIGQFARADAPAAGNKTSISVNSNQAGAGQESTNSKMVESGGQTRDVSEALAEYRAVIESDREALTEYRRVLEDERRQKDIPISTFIAVLSLVVTLYFSWRSRQHNRYSVRPLPFVRQPDYENRIAVAVENNGTGPMILKSAKAKAEGGTPNDLVYLVPQPPAGLMFRNFNTVTQPRAIRPGDSIDLIDLELDLAKPTEKAYQNELRKSLGHLTLELHYTDVYRTRFAPYVLPLNWFHRHWPELVRKGSK